MEKIGLANLVFPNYHGVRPEVHVKRVKISEILD
jgi:hypothetical protein